MVRLRPSIRNGQRNPDQQLGLVSVIRALASNFERPRASLTGTHLKFFDKPIEQFNEFVCIKIFQVGQAIENMVNAYPCGETHSAFRRSNQGANRYRCFPKRPTLMPAHPLAKCF
ncbi:MAG: hypothetical protein O7G13_03655 [Alphaproteobacteria bacterium]|nr:hypothetical protein [Alphaproteobacteria bacterium]MCZ6509990.1 hypothetical protein [Alphaproteobacteria bacterium]MCZ6591869.1 hypothetical protein [Alphaproteobacteria bacterium]MCZ6838351.1 hypothetical protein [Alphaproteobacteria bacterium]MCZ6845734.1 hypothetical protein [Alphaproteobacteria bacterium]